MRLHAVAAVLLTAMSTIHAASPVSDDEEIAKVSAAFKQMLGGRAELQGVARTPIAGLYEVSAAGGIIYTDASARYIINGSMVDAKTGANITTSRISDINRVKWSDLPLENAIKTVKGNGQRHMAVFADPFCPYCKRLEQSLQYIDNVTVYTFLYPVISDNSEAKSRQIWCAADRARAWQDWMLKGVSRVSSNCKAPLQENLRLGEKLHVSATPGIIFADGSRISGAIDVPTLGKKLEGEKKTP